VIPGIKELVADKGYDTDAFRAFLKRRKIRIVIPGKLSRKKCIRHDRQAYKPRNVMVASLQQTREVFYARVCTRYYRCGSSCLTGISIHRLLRLDRGASKLRAVITTTKAALLGDRCVGNCGRLVSTRKNWASMAKAIANGIATCVDGIRVALPQQCRCFLRPRKNFPRREALSTRGRNNSATSFQLGLLPQAWTTAPDLAGYQQLRGFLFALSLSLVRAPKSLKLWVFSSPR
jgi:hypothetical protein